MNQRGVGGAAWLGIGAQRSGTTWFTNLLLQHPDVGLSTRPEKELHLLHSALATGMPDAEVAEYQALFDGADVALPGEFTPAYLRFVWLPEVAFRVTRPDAPVLVLLRDPISRFFSALRHYERSTGFAPSGDQGAVREWARAWSADAQWGGMYADQLAPWERRFGGRLVVLQYEAAVLDPQAAVGTVWHRLGLQPVPLADTSAPSATTTRGQTGHDWHRLPDLPDRLRDLYAPQVDALERRWGIDRSLWPNFA